MANGAAATRHNYNEKCCIKFFFVFARRQHRSWRMFTLSECSSGRLIIDCLTGVDKRCAARWKIVESVSMRSMCFWNHRVRRCHSAATVSRSLPVYSTFTVSTAASFVSTVRRTGTFYKGAVPGVLDVTMVLRCAAYVLDYLRQGGYVFAGFCLFVCLSVC